MGDTPLLVAAGMNRWDAARALLTKGAALIAQNNVRVITQKHAFFIYGHQSRQIFTADIIGRPDCFA
jgi:hypothetical protein